MISKHIAAIHHILDSVAPIPENQQYNRQVHVAGMTALNKQMRETHTLIKQLKNNIGSDKSITSPTIKTILLKISSALGSVPTSTNPLSIRDLLKFIKNLMATFNGTSSAKDIIESIDKIYASTIDANTKLDNIDDDLDALRDLNNCFTTLLDIKNYIGDPTDAMPFQLNSLNHTAAHIYNKLNDVVGYNFKDGNYQHYLRVLYLNRWFEPKPSLVVPSTTTEDDDDFEIV